MKRVAALFPSVTAFDTLRRAAWRAARGKRRTAGVARFLERLEPEILDLEARLEAETWWPGRGATFRIRDPKERTITVAPFADRVVHHALIGVLEPWFERRMVFESFACRTGKGTHAALDHAERQVRRFDWFLKLDVRQCFASLDHDVVVETVARIVKDRRVLGLVRRIVRGAPATPETTGLPIGALTSQWFANLVLDRLDHFVKEDLRIKGYVRYMDDFVLFSSTKERLQEALRGVEEFLAGQLRLSLKDRATILAPTSVGLPFLGWRLYRRCRRLRPENERRTEARLKRRLWQFQCGLMDEGRLASCVGSVVAHLACGSTTGWRRRRFALHECRGPPT